MLAAHPELITVALRKELVRQGNILLVDAKYAPALELHKATADTLNQAHSLIAIGTVYVTQQNYAAALDNYQQALAIYESLDRKAETAETLTKLAAVYRLQGDYGQGLQLVNKALTLIQGADLPTTRSAALTEVGRLQRGLNRNEEALNAFDEAIGIQGAARYQVATHHCSRWRDMEHTFCRVANGYGSLSRGPEDSFVCDLRLGTARHEEEEIG